MAHDLRTVFQSPQACIQDFRCDGQCRHTQAEECTQAYELVFVRRGAWVRRDSSGRRLADVGQLVFFNAGAPYELCTTMRPIAEIAHDVAFYDHAHFTSTFTRHFGRSPSEARATARVTTDWSRRARVPQRR